MLVCHGDDDNDDNDNDTGAFEVSMGLAAEGGSEISAPGGLVSGVATEELILDVGTEELLPGDTTSEAGSEGTASALVSETVAVMLWP